MVHACHGHGSHNWIVGILWGQDLPAMDFSMRGRESRHPSVDRGTRRHKHLAGAVGGFFDGHPLVNWRHENLMRLFFRALRAYTKPGGIVKAVAKRGGVWAGMELVVSEICVVFLRVCVCVCVCTCVCAGLFVVVVVVVVFSSFFFLFFFLKGGRR